MQEIILSNAHLQMGILPELGASVSFLKYDKNDILRPMDTQNDTLDSNSAAMFLMLPFCGRIRGGNFVYWGITRKMKKNQAGIADPIHGDGWKSSWNVVSKTPSSITLKMTHDKEEGFPFPYTAEVTYLLKETSVVVDMKISNHAPLPMPCGMGIHPFFVKTKDMELKFPSRVVWAHESDPIFDRPYSTPTDWQFKEGKPIKNMIFDTCFGGFEGEAKITYPENGYAVEMSTEGPFGHVVLYSPKGKNFVCLEPCTNASNSFNLASNGVIGTGIQSIGKDQTLTGTIELKITK